jgi:hypothetical protein
MFRYLYILIKLRHHFRTEGVAYSTPFTITFARFDFVIVIKYIRKIVNIYSLRYEKIDAEQAIASV